MEQDKLIGIIMASVGSFFILLEFLALFIFPYTRDGGLEQFPEAQFWAMAIPIFIATAGVLAIIVWIGITMYMTPPPEVMEFEDIEEVDLEDEKEKSEKKEEKPKKTKKASSKTKSTPKAETKKEEPKAAPKKKAQPKEEPKEEVKEEAASDLGLTDIKGIGASTADDLKAAGYDTVAKIANATVEELMQIKGVGKASATKYINNAKDLM